MIKILNQDRDQMFDFIYGKNTLRTELKIENDIFYGNNLMLDDNFLGTFDSADDAMAETENILNCLYPFYVIGGFEDYEECFN